MNDYNARHRRTPVIDVLSCECPILAQWFSQKTTFREIDGGRECRKSCHFHYSIAFNERGHSSNIFVFLYAISGSISWLFTILLMQMHRLGGFLAHADIEHFHHDREGHCKVDVTLRYMHIKAFDNQCDTNQYQE